ncbi:MAG: flagellar hook-length control protein FliK [Muribaculaceae bacterium]|nr:flagellar hook-length control protein FliK [Muribaculaceae bacterium]
MTSANVFNWAANTGPALNANAAPAKAGDARSTVTGAFASMMHMGYRAASPQTEQKPVQAPQGSASAAYDRYQRREADIAQTQTPEIADKIVEATDELGDFKEQITAVVAEELEVTEDEVVSAMETLGLTVFDLMDPQKLVQLAMELTGATDSSELLTNPKFMELMQETEALGNKLMESLELPKNQMDALIAQLDAQQTVEPETDRPQEAVQELQTQTMQKAEPAVQNEQEQEKPVQELQTQTAQKAKPAVQNEQEQEKPVQELQTQTMQEAKPAVQNEQESVPAVQEQKQTQVAVEISKEVPVEPQKELSVEQHEETKAVPELTPETAGAETKEEAGAGNPNADTQSGLFQKQARPQQNFAVSEPVTNAVLPQEFNTVPELQNHAYLSIDAMDIIEQIAEQVKVHISEAQSSIEMQLNPENLGKVYLQVTAKEGAVHAQLAAANEAVRQALEVQMAELKESLNQAGVKVDAIEVTVASHEFEQNLEQGAEREKQEGERAEEKSHRRNLKLDSLDELSGVISEEEALVAQMMRENGNSMDLSA